ncbi:hypothetical protein HRbin15_00741 [bacterium HR15]|nr:hypothetical protein HRbin15_00741 [bacterium HR15]
MKKPNLFLIVGIFFLLGLCPAIVGQIEQTFNILLFFIDLDDKKFCHIATGDPIPKVVSTLGEPAERIKFEGSRLSDQRDYDEILCYDRIEYEVYVYAKNGQVMFSALITHSPLPLTHQHSNIYTTNRVFISMFVFIILILLMLQRLPQEVDYRPFIWAALAGMLAIGSVIQPFFWLSKESLLFSAGISVVSIALWISAFVWIIKIYNERSITEMKTGHRGSY